MKQLRFVILTLCLFESSVDTALGADPAPASVSVSPATVVVDKVLDFQAADGKSVTLEKGSYLVVPDPAGGLRLTAPSGKSFAVTAATATHAEKVTQAQALIVPAGDDERHLVLLLPDGKRLEAIGFASGIRPRGLASPTMVTNVALQTAVANLQPAQRVPPAPAPAPAPAKIEMTATLLPLAVTYAGLNGWADLHTHPMINLAFGGKLIHGGVDVGALLPTDNRCNNRIRATSLEHALGDDRPSHGGWDAFSFPCGDDIRKLVIMGMQKANRDALVTAGPRNPPALGFPPFDQWPAWNDITHQKMWWEWIRRARDGGQRVMVALATNNRTLGDAVSGPGDGPTDDVGSGDLQLNEIKSFVARHPDFMEVALTSADLKRIVQSNRIAVVLGVELDNIGNFNFLPPALMYGPNRFGVAAGEIQRLYAAGVRYMIPIHVVDNAFGGTAIYQPLYNVANFRDTGRFWQVECASQGDDIAFRYTGGFDPMTVAGVKIGFNPANQPPSSPACPQGIGHRNALSLTDLGAFAIREMMRRGMIIDIDHMSTKAVDQVLAIAESINPPVGYPINSGHSGVRGLRDNHAENSRSKEQLRRIARLHGMFGLGSDGVHAWTWSADYQRAMEVMGYKSTDAGQAAAYRNGAIAFGTDLNGLVKGPPPGGPANRVSYDPASFPPSGLAGTSKTWNYNTHGVAHYGMLPDFIRDVRTSPPSAGYVSAASGAELVDNHLLRSADYFWRMWERCEAQRVHVR